MKTNLIFLADFTDPRFRAAFQTYFTELGIAVKKWDDLFQEMNTEGNNCAYLLLSEADEVIGFLQFQRTVFTNWFFEEPLGFIREFWVAPAHRKQGCGTQLLNQTEQYLASQNMHRSILTADNAIDFYLARGYEKSPGITAKNKMEVLTKHI